MKNKKKKKLSGNKKRKRILFKKNKKKIIELKKLKKIKEVLPEKIESGLEKEIEETNVERFKDILKKTKSSPVLERITGVETNLEQEIDSAPVSEKKEDEKINYSPNQENSKYFSETPGRERTNNIEYPSGNISEISTRAISQRQLHDFRNVVNEPTVRKEKYLNPMRGDTINATDREGNIIKTTEDNREKTFEVFDQRYIAKEAKEKKYNEFKQ